MADVWAENRQGSIKINIENIIWFGKRILEMLNVGRASISIVITDSDEIRDLNREYLGRDGPTNVISFSMKEGEAIAGDDAYYGDVVVSADAARKEAAEYGYGTGEMFLLYIIHGILHLFGYNHEGVSEAEAERMEEKQLEMFEFLSPYLVKHPLDTL